jgi:hypothetical protein
MQESASQEGLCMVPVFRPVRVIQRETWADQGDYAKEICKLAPGFSVRLRHSSICAVLL